MRKKTVSFILAIGALAALSFGGRQAFAYDSAAAVAYAEQWWNGRNPNYNDYSESGGDCANFVSQCLIAGGLDLTVCETCTWIDSKGCLPRCRDLHTYLVDYLHATWETRPKGQVEPIWFLPGDPAIFGYSDAHPRTHAVFAVTGDATHYATCNAHSDNAHHVKISQFYTANPSFDRCTYYHIPAQTVPEPPNLLSPGTDTEPGPEIPTLTPTLEWQESAGADYYAIAISEYPYGSGNIVYNPQEVYGTSHPVPNGILQDLKKYRWNMQAHNSAGWSDVSNTLYFQTNIITVPEPPNLLSPGTETEPGPEIGTLTPTLQWEAAGADYYAIAISEYPYGSGNIVYNPQEVYGTSHPVPNGILQDLKRYRWNMQAHNSAGWSDVSNTLYFQTNIITVPEPPNLLSPGTETEPGPEIGTLTPTLQWEEAAGADYYAIAISEYPYGSGNIVYNPQEVYGTSHPVPSGILQDLKKYRWNMQAHNSAGWSGVSNTLYFQTNVEEPVRVQGIDVSSIQGYVDWSEVYNTGYRFAFARASWGDENPPAYIDDYFETNMQNGHAASMLMGAYHFAYPEYTDPVSEAHHFLNVAGDYLIEGYLRPVLDLEDDPGFDSYPYRLGKEALSNWVHEWMSTVKNQTGIEPIIYLNSHYANNYLDTSIADYDLWIAHWTYNPDIPPDTGIWDDWDFWQYSDQGSVPGIISDVDLDLFNGDMSALSDFIISVSSTGWKSPTGTGGGDNDWTNPENAYTSDNQWATAEGTFLSQDYYNFNFGIPAGATIDGIEAEIEGHGDTGGEEKVGFEIWSESDPGWATQGGWLYWIIGNEGVDAVARRGGPTDKWGETWIASDFDNGTFKAKLKTWSVSDKRYIDHIKIKVYYTPLKGDINVDSKVDFYDFAVLGLAWLSNAGDSNWNPACDISTPKDNVINERDLAVLCENWLAGVE